jgi:phosphoribosylanthranilate isomerase
MSLKIKICGMREPENILEVANLKPDLMGFIFYPVSPRYVGGTLNSEILSNLSPGIKKTGVFVNAGLDEIMDTISKYSLDMVQLHGDESPETCRRLYEEGIGIIKAFNLKDSSGYNNYIKYIPFTTCFLFDAFTPEYGGSGHKFDWEILSDYDLGHPFILSGGIAPGDIFNILEITNSSFYGIDLNSRFELKPGLKDIESLKIFISGVRNNKISL